MDVMHHTTHTASVLIEFHKDTGFAWNARPRGHMRELPSLCLSQDADSLCQDEPLPGHKQVFDVFVSG